MNLRYLTRGIFLLCLAAAPSVAAESQPVQPGCKTIEGLFAAYKKATENRDWKTLFLLGTPEQQDCELLMLTVGAATSGDGEVRRLVEKYGADWKQFDHPWSEADNQRFSREYSTIAASLGRQIHNKAEMFAAVRSYIDKKDPASTEVHELKNLVRHGATARGVSIESRTCMERHYDSQGNFLRQVPSRWSGKSELCFRQINGRWFLATGYEVARAK